jgi:hypothetical protein
MSGAGAAGPWNSEETCRNSAADSVSSHSHSHSQLA